MHMNALQKSLIKTIAYFDLFDFAPTLGEIERWLLDSSEAPAALSTIRQALDQLPQIEQQQGMYYLQGRADLIEKRKQKYIATMNKWRHARKYIRLIALLPGVEAVWFANSVAWCNARQESDIDLMIITSPGKLWTARFWATGLMKILRQRPHEQTHDKALCLSLYMDRDHLNMEQYKIAEQDIHFSFWANQLYPLYDPNNIYKEYQQQNSWLNTEFAHLYWLEPIPQREIHLSSPAQFCKRILSLFSTEQWMKKIQLRIMPKKLLTLANTDNRVVVTDHILKFHDNDSREQRQQAWEKKVRGIL